MRVNWSKYDKYLGVVSDYQLSKDIGCNASSVQARRNKLKIKALHSVSRIDWVKYDCMLGTMMNNDLALIIGCSVCAVNQRRRHLGIASFQED